MPTLLVRAMLFLSSYSPLLVILAIRDSFEARLWSSLLVATSVVSVGLLVVYLARATQFEPHFVTAAEVRPRGTEAMSYIVTYLIPFVGIDLKSGADVGALVVLLFVIGVLYVNSNLIYVNPVLNLLGFHLFEVSPQGDKPSALLTRRTYIRPGEHIKVVSLGNYVLMERR